MNNLQSNERHLADRLRNVPAPDVERSWEQMRKLLDRDMPEGAGGWSGNRKWWWMGITAGIIMLSLWLTQQLNDSRDERLATRQAADKTAAVVNSTDNKTASANDDNNATQQVTGKNIDKDINSGDHSKPATADNGKSQDRQAVNSQNDKIITPRKSVDKNVVPENKNPQAVDKEDNSKLSSAKKNIPSENSTAGNISIGNIPATNVAAKDKNPQAKDAIISGDDKAADKVVTPETGEARMPEAVTVSTTLIAAGEVAGPARVFSTAEIIFADIMAIHGKTDRESAKQLRKQSIKADDRKMSRSSMRGGYGDQDKEITFAAGLTIPQSFAIGGQQASSYNVTARTSRLTDYLPAPFFQYYINPKLFLQTELHFQSPQYTERLLLSRSTQEPSPTIRLERNVYLEKLYYFNVPFNVYYSPAKNFFIGSGLQYSSLLSGVASFEEKRTDGLNPASYQSVTRRFKDDSVAAKFAPSEWRYQFDANYYFKRFTLGVRYNQAMRDFVNLRVNSTLPVTQDRNRSFLLYLRFNIWEERKKGGYYSAYNW